MPSQPRTYSTKLTPGPAAGEALVGYAQVFSQAVRTAYSALERAARTGQPLAKAPHKLELAHRFGLTSRQAGSVLVEAQGRRDGQLELQAMNLEDAQSKRARHAAKAARCAAQLTEHRDGKTLRLSQKKATRVRSTLFHASTRVQSLTAAVKRLTPRVAEGHTSMTFGTKKLARQRAALQVALDRSSAAAERAPLEQQLTELDAAWALQRNGQFLVVGSRDETAGCQGCICTVNPQGGFDLALKLPNALAGERLLLQGLTFKHGAAQLRHALAQPARRAAALKVEQAKCNKARADAQARGEDPDVLLEQTDKEREKGKAPRPKYPRTPSGKVVQGGAALTWRFMRQADGRWEVSCTTDVVGPEVVTDLARGAIGIDLNSGFLTMAETNAHGSILSSVVVQTPEIGLDANQRADARGCAVKQVVARCLRTGKPLALERLDFRKKKQELTLRAPGSKRKLHALAYTEIQELLRSRALDAGVEVIDIDPAYTSTQGWVCYAAARGWTVHQAAAGVIARRAQGFSERAPVSGVIRLPVAGTAVECAVPEETARSDVSKRWPLLHRSASQAIASHHRQRRRGADPAARTGASVVLGEAPKLNRTRQGPRCAG